MVASARPRASDGRRNMWRNNLRSDFASHPNPRQIAIACHGNLGRRMSAPGLGCVKTQRRCDGVERAFHQVSFLVVETSRACPVAIDFGKLFSSSFDFLSFYTARVNRVVLPFGGSLPIYTRQPDILRSGRHVSKVPISEVAALFNHLVGAAD